MNPDIEKLIKAAEAKGEITERQRSIILSKAEAIGEDSEEVEFYLDYIPIKDSVKKTSAVDTQAQSKKRKCPNCGAYVSAMEVDCPECGCRMENESDASTKTRQIITELQSNLQTKRRRTKDKVEMIGLFSVPLTFDAQVVAFNHAKSQYDAIKSVDNKEEEAKAWLGKAKEFYSNIASMQTNAPGIANWLNLNSSIIKIQGKRVFTTGSKIIAFLMVCVILLAVYLEWTLLSCGSFWKIILTVYSLCMLGFIACLPMKEI